MKWQPIETYPCEPGGRGPDALLFESANCIEVGAGSWYAYDENPEYSMPIDFRYGCCGMDIKATHWMPLPDAP